ncbi:MAG: polysaccharide biosynthesis/export family protein [Cyanobacteria bacterium P01_A01_bin.40]
MKSKSVLYKLFLDRVNSYSAFVLGFGLALIATPAIAQDNTIELQDAKPGQTSTEQSEFNYRDLPPLEDQKIPSSNPNQPISPLPPASPEFATSETDYTLGAGDKINLDIFQVEEYSGEYPVLVDGTISLPLVGRVDVTGLSLKETSEVVSKEYATYLKRPIITVGLVAPRPLRIGIAGEVDNPGAYEVALTLDSPQFPTVTDMLEQAGGITTIADVRNVRVSRQSGGKEVLYNANLWDLLTKNQIRQDISLRDGDTIFVPTTDEINTAELDRLAQASFGLQSDKPIKIAVVGEVYRPGSHFIQPELLSRDTNNGANQGKQESIPPRLSQAINAANGIKPLANIEEVQVKRTSWDGEEKLIAVNLWEVIQSGDTSQDIILQEGDRVIIPEATAISEGRSQKMAEGTFSPETITVNVVGEVVTPGPVEVRPNTPLNQAILAAGGFDTQRANKNEVELVSLKPNGTVDKRKIKVDLGAEVNAETNPVLGQNDVVVVGRSGTTSATDALGSVTGPLGGAFGFLNFLF